MIALLLAGALCPEYAVSAGAGIYVQTVPAYPVVGQPVQLQCWVYWFPWSFWGQNAAVGGGTVTLVAGRQVIDATPTNGVPLMGDKDCATNWYCQLPTQTCVFTNAGSTLITATYLGYADVYPIVVSQVRLIPVRDNKIHIEKNGLIYWFGEGRYALEASEDLQHWSTIATLAGSNGYYQFQDTTNNNRRFYRYKVAP